MYIWDILSGPEFNGLKGLSTNQQFSVCIVNALEPVRKITASHKLSPICSQLLGKSLVAVALLSASLKGEERVLWNFNATYENEKDSTVKIYTEGICGGSIRGYLKGSFKASAARISKSRMDEPDVSRKPVSGPFSEGFVKVSSLLYGRKFPHHSVIPVKNGDVCSEFQAYLESSLQFRNSHFLHVSVDAD
eukprot:Sdes_comp22880_c0_seq1m21255